MRFTILSLKLNTTTFFLKRGEGIELPSKDLSGAEGSTISVLTAHDPNEEYKCKTVRQLSRLWRYLDGADPDGQA
jgi:hypothetical protein